MKSKSVIFLLAGFTVFVHLASGNYVEHGPSRQETTSMIPAFRAGDTDPIAASMDFEKPSENYATRWYESRVPGKTRGVALVVHGLNLRPDKMQSIIAALTGSGIEVLGLSLRGHGDNFSPRPGIEADQARLESFKAVSYPLWLNEAYLAYAAVQNRAAHKNVPPFFVGFSLGGLVGLDLFSFQEEVRFDRMVLFAPALKLHAIHYLARIISPFPRLVIPSLAPAGYLSNKKGTPIAAYNALFEGLEQFEKHVNPKINVPTLIFIDRQDEFIPLRSLRALIEEEKLNHWEIYVVEKNAAADQHTFHHHLIDEYSTGKTVWQDMMDAAINHLLTN